MTRQIKSAFVLLSICGFSQFSNAQVVDNSTPGSTHSVQDFLPVAAGVPFSDSRYVEAQGSAYFDQQWSNSTVITTARKAYEGVPVRIDLLAGKVHYKENDGRELVVNAPLREVKLGAGNKTVHFVNGDILANKRNGWFQLLVNDSVSLLKSYRKIFEEKPSYGGNLLYIKTSEVYFVYLGADEFPVKKISDLVAVLPAKKAEIEAEAKRLKSSSKEDQLIGVVAYMNTLVKG